MVEYQVGQINSYNGDTQVHNFEMNKDLSDLDMGNGHFEIKTLVFFYLLLMAYLVTGIKNVILD